MKRSSALLAVLILALVPSAAHARPYEEFKAVEYTTIPDADWTDGAIQFNDALAQLGAFTESVAQFTPSAYKPERSQFTKKSSFLKAMAAFRRAEEEDATRRQRMADRAEEDLDRLVNRSNEDADESRERRDDKIAETYQDLSRKLENDYEDGEQERNVKYEEELAGVENAYYETLSVNQQKLSDVQEQAAGAVLDQIPVLVDIRDNGAPTDGPFALSANFGKASTWHLISCARLPNSLECKTTQKEGKTKVAQALFSVNGCAANAVKTSKPRVVNALDAARKRRTDAKADFKKAEDALRKDKKDKKKKEAVADAKKALKKAESDVKAAEKAAKKGPKKNTEFLDEDHDACKEAAEAWFEAKSEPVGDAAQDAAEKAADDVALENEKATNDYSQKMRALETKYAINYNQRTYDDLVASLQKALRSNEQRSERLYVEEKRLIEDHQTKAARLIEDLYGVDL